MKARDLTDALVIALWRETRDATIEASKVRDLCAHALGVAPVALRSTRRTANARRAIAAILTSRADTDAAIDF